MVNRLAQSQSLYLRKHAENPIDWWPWCDEALETARSENKPIFLSIGYSSCHWCTVMEGEAFSDRAIAQYMNSHFIPIKVDREERPDIDSIYMQTLQMMTGQGGCAAQRFSHSRRASSLLRRHLFPRRTPLRTAGIFRSFASNSPLLRHRKRQSRSLQSRDFRQPPTVGSAVRSNRRIKSRNLSKRLRTQHRNYCGQQPGPSFPMIPYAELALRGTRFNFESKYDSKQVCTQRGLDLALGGIYDHVGGGFHRYTVDATWTVPHFEKMLYDNGQIVEYLANLWSAGIQEPLLKQRSRGQ